MNALLANQQLGGDSLVEVLVEGLQERSRLKMTEELTRSIIGRQSRGGKIGDLEKILGAMDGNRRWWTTRIGTPSSMATKVRSGKGALQAYRYAELHKVVLFFGQKNGQQPRGKGFVVDERRQDKWRSLQRPK